MRPRDVAGKTRRRIAAEELADLVAVEKKMRKAAAELKVLVKARGSRLMDLPGVGPVVAARTPPTTNTPPGATTSPAPLDTEEPGMSAAICEQAPRQIR